MRNQRHYHLLTSRWVCLTSGKVTAAVTQKHVKTVRRRKRRASEIDITKSSKMFKPMFSWSDVSTLKIPCSDSASRTKPDDIDKKKY